ncbi:DUF6461 domain-containing protein [Streptosporangium sp. NPDC049046]|uniref:DUF6461 domain-containing protein n=1 Tax=Streptosporangium sp. NPDC049046 TaxID=3155031 RepID=UPI00343FE7D4
MITNPAGYTWLVEAMDGACLTYIHGLTPEEVMARRGGRPEDFTPMSFWDLGGAVESGAFLGVTTIGDWVLTVEPGLNGIAEEVIMPLSTGTRVVSHYFLSIKDLDHFYWIEDGELRFCFIAQEGYSQEVPEVLVETMERIDSIYPSFPDPHKGPMFLLAERLTGITLTPQLLEESTYLGGAVPEPRSWKVPWPR